MLVMASSEPAFVPEWLRSNGTKKQQKAPSMANTDGCVASKSSNVSSPRLNGSYIGCSSVSDRTSSAYFRRSSSSNGSSDSRSSGSYDRGNRDKEWDKEKFNTCHKNNGYSHSWREYSYLSGNRSDKDLRRTCSSLNGKQGGTWTQRGLADMRNSYKITTEASFELDFPSPGAEDRQRAPEIRRVSSRGLTTSVKSLPTNGWTSALAEVPVTVGNDGVVRSPQQTSSNDGETSVTDSLTPSPSRSNSSSPQLPTETQKVEEQAVKRSRQLVQLVPMTSSMPKALVHNASEKLKPKVGQQMQISSSLQSNHLSRGKLVKSDVSRASGAGQHVVLKPEREGNNVYPTLRSPITTSRLSTPLASDEHKPKPILERKPYSQAKSRNDFFNQVRKKSLETPQSVLSPSDLDKGDTSLSESLVADGLVHKDSEIIIKDESCFIVEKFVNECRKECSSFKAFSYSEEKEVAFLYSLGWKKTEGEEEDGLTKEEINAFYEDLNEQIKSRPSSRSLQRMQLKFSRLLNDHTGVVINGCISS